MTTDTLVSIIMPSFNSARFIAESIEGILRQTYTNWELLITDDCSTDDSVAIAQEYARQDSRIKVHVLESNGGAGVARNHSIREASGRYLAFCDSDDVWLPEKLEKQLAFMQRNHCEFCFASYHVCDEKSKRTGMVIAPRMQSLVNTKHDDKIGFLTAIYDTARIGKIYMPHMRKRQDWAYVLMVLQQCKMAYAIQEPLAVYRISKGSISHNKFSLIKYNVRVYEEVFGYSRLHAIAYFLVFFLPTYGWKQVKKRLEGRR